MLQKEGPRKHHEITCHGTESPRQGTSCQVCMVTREPSEKILAWERQFSRKGPDKTRLAAGAEECTVVQGRSFQ